MSQIIKFRNNLLFATFFISILVVCGWLFDILYLKQLHSSFVSMKFNTAVCFILGSAAAYLVASEWSDKMRLTTMILCSCLLLLAGMTLIEYLASPLNLGIDELFVSDNTKEIGTSHPGRMAPNTSLSFVVLSFSLILARRNTWLSQIFSIVVLLISLLAIIGYITGVEKLYGIASFTEMALHTSVSFILLSIAVLLSFPMKAIMKTLFTDSQTSGVLRRIVPFVLTAYLGLSVLIMYGQNVGLYERQFSYMLLVLSSIITTYGIVYYQASKLLALETELNIYCRKLESTAKELSDKSEELAEISYIVSHDLKEPVRTIKGFSQLLSEELRDYLTKDGKECLEFIESACNRMQLLIKDLLDYGHLGKERIITDVDCARLVEAVLEDLSFVIEESNACVTVGDLPTIRGYKTELRLLFQNLISNSLKYKKKEVQLKINIRCEEVKLEEAKHWLFKIEDNGIGMEEAYSDVVFKMFQQIHPRDEYEGSGIGLSHCKKICQLHNGSIRFESKVGEGTSFIVAIPVSQD